MLTQVSGECLVVSPQDNTAQLLRLVGVSVKGEVLTHSSTTDGGGHAKTSRHPQVVICKSFGLTVHCEEVSGRLKGCSEGKMYIGVVL
jgi:hypothetical protein